MKAMGFVLMVAGLLALVYGGISNATRLLESDADNVFLAKVTYYFDL